MEVIRDTHMTEVRFSDGDHIVTWRFKKGHEPKVLSCLLH